MTTTQVTQEQVDRIAQELAPDVVRIRFNLGEDWAGYPAIYFRVVLSDEASKPSRLRDNNTEDVVIDSLGLRESEHFPYFSFRSESEQASLTDPAWY